MKFVLWRNASWIRFVMKVAVYVVTVNLFVLPVLWILGVLSAIILVYEGTFLMLIGGIQFFVSFLYYKENAHSTIDQKYPYPGSGLLNHRIVFKKLKSEERKRYRQEGIIMVLIGLIVWLAAAVSHLLIFGR